MFTLPTMANTTYTYTGNPFTSVIAPYTTSSFVSGWFTVASPLGNWTDQMIRPLDYAFSDGLGTPFGGGDSDVFAGISADASGNILTWDIALYGIYGRPEASAEGAKHKLNITSKKGKCSTR